MARKSAKQIGALWVHRHEQVQGIFLSGILDLGGLGEVRIAIFRNTRKEEGKQQPDYRMVLSQPIEGSNSLNGVIAPEPDPLDEGALGSEGQVQPEPEEPELADLPY